jgi:uncharacterized 2Fe-2S/4Fe-4S cluster protein (DUF4445 family)
VERKETCQLEHIDKLSKSNQVEQPESSQQAASQSMRKDGGGKAPYCFRCKTKGHAIESCHAFMYYEVCDSHDHLKVRCLKFRAAKMLAIPCGYAVEGLGFFHIPNDVVAKQKIDARSALIRVMEGTLVSQEVVSKLEKLIPGDWSWKVEEACHNLYRTFFNKKMNCCTW